VFNGGRWWYWTPQNRGSYYDNGNWADYTGGNMGGYSGGYSAGYAPGETTDCTAPAGGYSSDNGGYGQGGYMAGYGGLDPRYRFDNGQWYYQTDNGWLTYNDGRWIEPTGSLPDFIIASRGRGFEQGREGERREAAREDLRGREEQGRNEANRTEGNRNEAGRTEAGRGENPPQPAARTGIETPPEPARTESREQTGRGESKAENNPTAPAGNNERGERR
jgi:hypothetical protein